MVGLREPPILGLSYMPVVGPILLYMTRGCIRYKVEWAIMMCLRWFPVHTDNTSARTVTQMLLELNAGFIANQAKPLRNAAALEKDLTALHIPS